MVKFLQFFWFLLFVLVNNSFAQKTFSGKLSNLAGQTILLLGFEGFDSYLIDKTKISNDGDFQLCYGEKDFGMAVLQSENGKKFYVILNNENFKMEGTSLDEPKSIVFYKSYENQKFKQYSTDHNSRINTITAWEYLLRIYEDHAMFRKRRRIRKNIQKEKLKIIKEDDRYLKKLNQDSYVKWFLPLRKLISDVPTIAQYQTYLIDETIQNFRMMDYNDERLWKSGLLNNAIESHFWLIENSGKPLDLIYDEMAISIDVMIDNLKTNELKQNHIFDYLFNLLEQHSLFKASEYLALKLLNDENCSVSDDLTHQLETYRKMKIGNIAKDLVFDAHVTYTKFTGIKPKKLSDIEGKYKLVFFGASWCPACVEEIPKILSFYEKWKSFDLDVVYISLDTDTTTFSKFTKILPFTSICDFQKWESPLVKAYHVYATPTMYILSNENKILLRPNSANQVDAWLRHVENKNGLPVSD